MTVRTHPLRAEPARSRWSASARALRLLAAPVALAAVVAAQAPATLTVRPGDTLWGIAQRSHTSVEALQRLNHLRSDRILIGQVLTLSAGTPSAAPVGARPAEVSAPQAAAARDRALLAGRRVPSRDAMRALVSRAARAAGLDPALALAIATQESGFNAQAVSPADAVGVMQVLPSTADWLGSMVLHRRLDPLDPTDNVVAGVTLLKLLTSAAPLPQAIGGYYQGLSSVLARGFYSDTRAYVANVLALRARYLRH